MAGTRSNKLISMTGFGRAQVSEGVDTVSVQINSVNSRYLKINTRLPEILYPFERDIHEIIRKNMHRGAVGVYITHKSLRPETSYTLNGEAIKGYVRQLRKLKKETNISPELRFETLLSLPGVVTGIALGEKDNKRVWRLTGKTLDTALAAMQNMRAREGSALQKDLSARVGTIKTMLSRVQKYAPSVAETYRKKLHTRIKVLLNKSGATLDKNDLIREVAIFADRCDISEEISRMASHIGQFLAVARGETLPGRKLDFIAQEMLRETNTMGSKANSAPLTKFVVQMKAEIDKIKEQLQNVE